MQLDNSANQTDPSNDVRERCANAHIVGGFAIHRRFDHLTPHLAQTDVAATGKFVKTMAVAMELALRLDSPPDANSVWRLEVREIELVATKEVGPAIFLVLKDQTKMPSDFQEILNAQRRKWYGATRSALARRSTNGAQMEFESNADGLSSEAMLFQSEFNRQFRTSAEIVLLNPYAIESSQIVRMSAIDSPQPLVSGEPRKQLIGTVTGFRGKKGVFTFEGERGEGSFEVEITKPDIFFGKMLLLYSTRTPVRLTLGVARIQAEKSQDKFKNVLLSIDEAIDCDWDGQVSILKCAATELQGISTPAANFLWQGVAGPSGGNNLDVTSNGDREEQAMQSLSTSDEASVSLKDREPHSPDLVRPQLPRGRKKWQSL